MSPLNLMACPFPISFALGMTEIFLTDVRSI
jgi:hypothetical protein